MKKIGIITFHKAINYGAVWQTYALSTYLQTKGFKVEVIDYFPKFLQKYHYQLPKKPISFVIRLLNIFQFNRFVKRKLPISANKFHSSEELKKNCPVYDYYICGSDQVWSSRITGNEWKPYFLDFVPNNLPKISYAASMGDNHLPEENKEYIKQQLAKFKKISVREPFAKSELETIGIKESEIVLDPTLLLDKAHYEEAGLSQSKEDYILIIDLSGSQLLKETALKIKKETGLQIINISGSYRSYAKNKLAISPVDWLSYIKNAKYVCINSFHGLVFSIIFNKNFFCIEQENNKNNRALHLLENLNLNNRYVRNIDDININESIDYKSVNVKLDLLKDKSFDFLGKALNL